MASSKVFRSIHRHWDANTRWLSRRRFNDAPLIWGYRLVLTLSVFGILCLFIGVSWLLLSQTADTLHLWQIALFLALPVLLFAIIYFLWADFLKPMFKMRNWLLRIHAGDLASRIPPMPGSKFEKLSDDLNSLSRMLELQSVNAEIQVQRHTQHMLEKNRSLGALYRISSSLNTLPEIGDLFANVMRTLEDIFNTKATIIRQRSDDGRMRYIASRGEIPSAETQKYINEDSPLLETSLSQQRYVVPIQHGGKDLGVCSFYLNEDTVNRLADMKELFASVGLHLGMAMEKSRLELENRRLSIIEERTGLAHELHDSLAQIISSLRFQTRILKHALDEDTNEAEVINEKLEQLETSVEAANREARDMITRFRSSDISLSRPKHRKNVLDEVDKYIAQFRQDHPNVQIYLQKSLPERPLPQLYETEVLRIIREAVANAHKHAQADFIRVLMRGDEAGNYRILIEDDGVGMQKPNDLQKHFGLDMIKDCASRIDGKLAIESEPNEGVRITLKFAVPNSTNEEKLV